ncbi:hypothetical protein [Pseudonocardia adelaidensis]|uniref:Molybdopterin-dependent oxidoreductase-like protein n=1 Tax=Pseudonocardia adelaidensis TaxID=648754 RepID=A0ABP9P5E5_9PSEU
MRVRLKVLAAGMLTVSLAGCGVGASGSASAPLEITAQTATAVAASSPPAQGQPAAGVVRLTGDLRDPRDLHVGELATLPQQTVSVQFGSGSGPQSHIEQGVLLSDLLPVEALATTDSKHDELTFGVLVTGSDGHAALVSYGEISPDFGNRGILLATSEDGAALERPRLVVPGDVKGARYVSEVIELRVVRTAGGPPE